MKLLLDEHFSPEIARQLRDRGHDVTAVREVAGLHGASGAGLLAWAGTERRAIVAENVADYVELHRRAILRGQPHAGLVFTSARGFPRTRRAMGRLVRALDELLAERPAIDALEAQVWWL